MPPRGSEKSQPEVSPANKRVKLNPSPIKGMLSRSWFMRSFEVVDVAVVVDEAPDVSDVERVVVDDGGG